MSLRPGLGTQFLERGEDLLGGLGVQVPGQLGGAAEAAGDPQTAGGVGVVVVAGAVLGVGGLTQVRAEDAQLGGVHPRQEPGEQVVGGGVQVTAAPQPRPRILLGSGLLPGSRPGAPVSLPSRGRRRRSQAGWGPGGAGRSASRRCLGQADRSFLQQGRDLRQPGTHPREPGQAGRRISGAGVTAQPPGTSAAPRRRYRPRLADLGGDRDPQPVQLPGHRGQLAHHPGDVVPGHVIKLIGRGGQLGDRGAGGGEPGGERRARLGAVPGSVATVLLPGSLKVAGLAVQFTGSDSCSTVLVVEDVFESDTPVCGQKFSLWTEHAAGAQPPRGATGW